MNDDLQTQLNAYITDLFAAEESVLGSINDSADRNDLPTIHLQPFEARLLQVLMVAVDARKVVEIGTLAGYSGAWLASALPADGKLYTIERSSKHAQVARDNFTRLGLSAKIEIIEGEALPSLEKLAAQSPFDFVFVDAEKTEYSAYFNWAAEHLRPGGMIAAHNALRRGGVLALANDSDQAVDAFNRALAAHPQFESTIIAVGDGMAVGLKKRP